MRYAAVVIPLLVSMLVPVVAQETTEEYDFLGEEMMYNEENPLETAIDNTLWFEPAQGWVVEGPELAFYDEEDSEYYVARLYSVYLYYDTEWGYEEAGYHLTNKTADENPVESVESPFDGDWALVDEQLRGIVDYYYTEPVNIVGPVEADGYLYYELDEYGFHYIECGLPVDEGGYANFCVECDQEWWPELEVEIREMLESGVEACLTYLAENQP